MDIYPAGEEPIEGVEAKSLAEGIAGHGHKAVHYCAGRDAAVEHLMEVVRPGDMVITLGAGNVWQVGEELAERLRKAAERG
jgi:UDP-N-acetylmuramate--alanine ligase